MLNSPSFYNSKSFPFNPNLTISYDANKILNNNKLINNKTNSVKEIQTSQDDKIKEINGYLSSCDLSDRQQIPQNNETQENILTSLNNNDEENII